MNIENQLSKMNRFKWSRTIVVFFLLLLIPLAFSRQVNADSPVVTVVMDGIKEPLASGHPYLENGKIMIPFRIISGKLGIQSAWDAKTKTLMIQQNGKKIVLTVGSSTANIDGNPVNLGIKVTQKEGVTMIPLSLVSDHLSAEVKIDDATGVVSIRTPNKEIGKVDDFGRKIRTTNLPKNYKDYPYILEDIPNEVYEMKISKLMYYKPDAKTGAQLYKNNEVTTEDMVKIMDRMKKGFDLRLNVDYKTINPVAFANEAFKYENQSISSRVIRLKEYAQWVQKNKIQIEGTIDPEPSLIYDTGIRWYFRSKVRFRIINYTEYKDLLADFLFDNDSRFKKGVWYEGYADISVSMNHNIGVGEYMNIGSMTSLFDNSKFYEVK
ncbi:copper amine oxidase N-terminal domain-containing protein [Paenibacillus azoreducens]|uniref:Copper amine oxidase-like N-terminal domain-containing protein n=1 Tax=Paenibacillus azoreducens TaxID=116718 RepID=A0A920CWK3_9BACL|nr:copper amine oxidase N-terminal domain-containing protein [Paenibacillus azoreducens]GIO51463.1 hypothetical protein J34TS1_62280 [Paenibacillus azoreducens]